MIVGLYAQLDDVGSASIMKKAISLGRQSNRCCFERNEQRKIYIPQNTSFRL